MSNPGQMLRLVPLLALCSCQQQPIHKPEAVLLVYWENVPGNFSREYATLAECHHAASVIDGETLNSLNSAEKAAKKNRIAPKAWQMPETICFPT